jgi:putative transposase
MLVKAVSFRLEDELPAQARFLLEDFRLAVNCAIRAGLQTRATSKYALCKLAYKDFRTEHPGMYSQHLLSVFEIAASVLKNHRRKVRKGKAGKIPYVKRLFMKTENQAYKLDRERGVVDLPIRAGCHVELKLVLSEYHRSFLDDPSFSLGSLTLFPDRVVIAFRKMEPRPYVPETVVSLDTNERSLDGVFVSEGKGAPVRAYFPQVATIQQTHHDRRKRLQTKKSHDRRISRRLCKREGKREHHRVEYQMHQVANAVLDFAEENKAAIVLEDLKGVFKPREDKSLNRRLSMWPRRKLHQFIEYKAQWRGIPVLKVDPRNSSRKCPVCGRLQDSRKGTEFVCECGWHLDRHINASLNLLQTAVSGEMVGGLRFDPGALQHDVMMILYDPEKGARSEPNGASCEEAAA